MSIDFTGINIGSALNQVAKKAKFTLDALNPESLTFEFDHIIQMLLYPETYKTEVTEEDKIVAKELRKAIKEMKRVESTWNFYLADPVVQLMMGTILSHQGSDDDGHNSDG